MSFKDKPLKKIVSDNRVTIDVLHKNQLNEFNNSELEIDELKNSLNILIEEYENVKCEKILIKINKLKDNIKILIQKKKINII